MGIRVQICIAKDVHVLLELANLCQISHEGFGDLLNQKGLVCYVEEDLLFLFRILLHQVGILLACTTEGLLLTLC